MDYAPCADLQRRVLESVIKRREEPPGGHGALPDTLLFVEHEPVLTLGASFQAGNLRLQREEYANRGIRVLETDRGGDVTYHGPDQLVIYPIFDVAKRGRDLHRWLRDLEEAVILGLRSFGLEGFRFPPNTGVWVRSSLEAEGSSQTPHSKRQARKIAAIGIKVRRWVSMHGIALNCSNDLSPFDLIVPCGLEGYGVTSLSEELGQTVGTAEVKPVIAKAFKEVFGLNFQQKTRARLEVEVG